MSFLLLDAMRTYLTEALAGLPLLDPASRERGERRRPPRVLVGELPPRNQDEEDGGYPFVLLRGMQGEDEEDFSTCNVSIICAVAAAERGEALEHEIQNLVTWTRRALLRKRMLGNRAELVPNAQGKLLSWEVYPEYAHPYVAAQIRGTWKMPGIQLTEESYVRD